MARAESLEETPIIPRMLPIFGHQEKLLLNDRFNALCLNAQDDALEDIFDHNLAFERREKKSASKPIEKLNIWTVKASHFPLLWETYKESGLDLSTFLEKILGCSLAPIRTKDLREMAKLKNKRLAVLNSAQKEQILMRKSIKRHVALHYGKYLLEGGLNSRNFKIPFCQMIGLSTSSHKNGKIVGIGGQGEIRGAKFSGSNDDFIIKSFTSQYAFVREIDALGIAEHANVIQPVCFNLISAGEYKGYQIILPAYTPNTEKHVMAMDDLRVFAKEISLGLFAIHRSGLLHLDMKNHNYVFAKKPSSSQQKSPVIIDFGLAITIKKALSVESKFLGTLFYLAPEQIWSNLPEDQVARQIFNVPKKLFVHRPLGRGTDWYNLGVALFVEAARLKNTFDLMAYYEANTNLDNTNVGSMHINYPSGFPPELCSFLDMLLRPDVFDRDWSANRSKLDILLNTPFLSPAKNKRTPVDSSAKKLHQNPFVLFGTVAMAITIVFVLAYFLHHYYHHRWCSTAKQKQQSPSAPKMSAIKVKVEESGTAEM